MKIRLRTFMIFLINKLSSILVHFAWQVVVRSTRCIEIRTLSRIHLPHSKALAAGMGMTILAPATLRIAEREIIGVKQENGPFVLSERMVADAVYHQTRRLYMQCQFRTSTQMCGIQPNQCYLCAFCSFPTLSRSGINTRLPQDNEEHCVWRREC